MSYITKCPSVMLAVREEPDMFSLPPHRCWPACESATQESRIHMRQKGGDLQFLSMPTLHPCLGRLLQREGQVLPLSWSHREDKTTEITLVKKKKKLEEAEFAYHVSSYCLLREGKNPHPQLLSSACLWKIPELVWVNMIA